MDTGCAAAGRPETRQVDEHGGGGSEEEGDGRDVVERLEWVELALVEQLLRQDEPQRLEIDGGEQERHAPEGPVHFPDGRDGRADGDEQHGHGGLAAGVPQPVEALQERAGAAQR